MTISRNAPCYCGSGKKYKKCCLGKEEIKPNKIVNALPTSHQVFETDIDKLTNETSNLIEKKEFKKAEENCKRLLKEFPDYIDGHERYGDFYSAIGEFDKAIESYEKAIQYMKANSGFDEETIDWYNKKIEELEKKI